MLALPRLKHDPIDDYDDICEAKQKPSQTVLLAARSKIMQAYMAYDGANGRLTSAITCSARERTALLDTYNVATKPMKRLRALLRDAVAEHAGNLCPYCLLGEPRTLDHHLAKTDFPEFSCLHLNLIPVCNECNEKKGSAAAALMNSYYFTALPDEQWLWAAAVPAPRIAVSYRCKPAPTNPLAAEIVDHFARLALCERYTRQTSELLSEIGAWKKVVPPLQLASSLLRVAREYASQLGRNYWKAVALEAIATNPSVLAAL